MYAILIGGLAGFLAGQIMKGSGYGILANIILGVLGSIIGGVIFGILGFHTSNLVGDIVAGTVGAVTLIALFGRKRRSQIRD